MKKIPKISSLEPKRRKDHVRKTVSGRYVPHYVDEQRLIVSTQCPQKWVFVDLEDGNIWTKDFEASEWNDASIAQMKDAITVLKQDISYQCKAQRLRDKIAKIQERNNE